MQWSAGSLVRARGRDWVALPSVAPDLVRLKPLTGPDHQEIGLYLPLEREVEPASFPRPDPGSVADAAAARLLFDAARLSLRSGAAPFRSLGHISVTPRPYQFVPLIMALRLDPVRLLIADDVGVGKTIEAGMIARELLDRGIVRRLCVLCPAHLCDQWERELRQKFAIEAAVVRPSTVARLERELPRQDLSIYEHYPHLIASIDFAKAERHRGPFLRTAPDLVIVDEAHGAARPRGDRERGLRMVLAKRQAVQTMRDGFNIKTAETQFNDHLDLARDQIDVVRPDGDKKDLEAYVDNAEGDLEPALERFEEAQESLAERFEGILVPPYDSSSNERWVEFAEWEDWADDVQGCAPLDLLVNLETAADGHWGARTGTITDPEARTIVAAALEEEAERLVAALDQALVEARRLDQASELRERRSLQDELNRS